MKKLWVILSLCCVFLFLQCRDISDQSFVIKSATIIDGSKDRKGFVADIKIVNGIITDIGDLDVEWGEGIVMAEGLVLAPGFIDTHSHHDDALLEKPSAMAAISQGITTIFIGQDGQSEYPIKNFFNKLEKKKIALNVASLVGHGTLRSVVMGSDFKRKSTPKELSQMVTILKSELMDGAFGLSSGLEYEPGLYADTHELVTLAKEAEKLDGIYASHIRNEDKYLWESVNEAIEIGEKSGIQVHVSHIKLARQGIWGQANKLISMFEEAKKRGVNVTGDIYPYTFWQSTMTIFFPDRDFTNKEHSQYALTELTLPEFVRIVYFESDPSLVGKTLLEIAQTKNVDPVDLLMNLSKESYAQSEKLGHSGDSVLVTSMDERDIVSIVKDAPTVNICSDGSLEGSHPRGRGSFPRLLKKEFRNKNALPLERVIYKMTGLAAKNMGMKKRGLIKKGYIADLVLFDPQTIEDQATVKNPHRLSKGVKNVWVSGVKVFDKGEVTKKFPGKVLRRE